MEERDGGLRGYPLNYFCFIFLDTISDIKSVMESFDMLLPQPDWLARMTNEELMEGIDKVLSEEMP